MKRWLAAAVIASAYVAAVALAAPDIRLALARIAIFAVSLIAAVRVIRLIAPSSPSAPDPFEAEEDPPMTRSEIAGIGRIEFDLHMATVHPFGIEWLKPLLRELASGRLLRHRGIDMERHPGAAKELLGEPLGRMIGDIGRWSAGEVRVSQAELEAGVARLEQL